MFFIRLKGYFFSWYTICLYSVVVVILSTFPFESPEQLSFSFSDKLAHGLMYLLLSFIAVNTFYLKHKKQPVFLGFLYAFSLGVLMEIVQSFLPFRGFELSDIFSNFIGSLMGSLMLLRRLSSVIYDRDKKGRSVS